MSTHDVKLSVAATVPLLRWMASRSDLLEQGVHDVLVPHDGQDPATGVQVAALGLRDELLSQRAQPLGLRLGGLDLPVPEELRGQVGQDQLLVRRAAAEAGTLRGRGHF
jgi:hypothetical protein